MTQSRTIAADDVTLIARRLPEVIPLCRYDGDVLTIPDDAVAEIDALLADDGWRLPSSGELRAYAADKRWQVETGGTTVAGIPVATDDRSKMMVTGARVAADANPSWSTTWIGSDGNPYPVDAAAMVTISDAVLAHINQSFETFGALLTSIDAGTVTTIAEIDAADWPANGGA